jgi:hypothetical protein
MSQTIDIRIYTQSTHYDALSLLQCIINAVSTWGYADEKWQGLRVAKAWPSNVIETLSEPFTTLELKASACRFTKESERNLSTGVGFHCWRFDNQHPTQGFLRLGVESWDSNSQRVIQGESWIEGNARLVISNAGPYWAILDNTSVANKEECNRRIAENLEVFLQLLFQLAKHIAPVSIKVFTDTGDLLPMNVHVLFSSNSRSVIADLKILSIVWEKGLSKYKLPPLRGYIPERHGWTLNELRDHTLQNSVWHNFSNLIRYSEQVSEEIVQSTLSSSDLDIYRVNEGFLS